jgi:hypothetical protein
MLSNAPRLDDLRKAFPKLGFAIYAMDPAGQVTFEVYDSDGEVYTFTGATEAEAISNAFPPKPEPVVQTNVFD